jgi:hypothetical protein
LIVDGSAEVLSHPLAQDGRSLHGCPGDGSGLGVALDRGVVEIAAVVLAPVDDASEGAAVSERVRNFQFHPYWGLTADHAWLASH